MVVSFDFIGTREFRQSLETDYSEMSKNYEAESWKSVQVIAGSIIEAILVDYLVSTENEKRPKKDYLKLELAEAINIAKAEGALSDRTSDLCSVIRSFRNLIHPGRMIRLKEPLPDQGSASIAKALVDIIIEEVSKSRRASIGLTAEQLISKILRDTNSLTILKHLIEEVNEYQKEKLLLEIIPASYQEISATGPIGDDTILDFENLLNRLEIAYRTIFNSVTDQTKARAIENFVQILREEDGEVLIRHSTAFINFNDLKYVQPQHREMVKEHLFSRIPATHSVESTKLMEGVFNVVTENDVVKWLDPYIRAIASTSIRSKDKNYVRQNLLATVDLLTNDLEKQIDHRLDDWIRHFEKDGATDRATMIRELKDEISTQRIPF